MTRVTIFRDPNGAYRGFLVSGHSGYANAGEDIVCAGISALTINTVNALDQLTDARFALDSDAKDGRINVRFHEPPTHDAELLMHAMILGLQGIQKDYGNEFLVLEDKEV